MPFVERIGAAGSGIVGEYVRPQPGRATEFVADTDAGLLAFRAGQLPGSSVQLPLERAAAKALLASDPTPDFKLDRAIILATVDELNALRQWITSFKAAMAAATTFADLKTRVAALASTPDRTSVQVKAAISAKLDTNAAD
jgi:hypothetical protein